LLIAKLLKAAFERASGKVLEMQLRRLLFQSYISSSCLLQISKQ
jgi:hypothetical protein